jgi:hypothetical protein
LWKLGSQLEIAQMHVSAKFCGLALLLGFVAFTSLTPVNAGMGFRGSVPTTIEGINWNEVLEKVPCTDITKVGNSLKITATLVINGTHHKNPMISEKDRVDILERRCPPKTRM